MGFVAYHTNSYQWIYRILAITNLLQFILYFFFSPETLYFRSSSPSPPTRGLKPSDFYAPLKLFTNLNILVPTIAYSIIFNFASVLVTVEIPQLFTPKWGFNAQEIGLQFLGLIVGSVLGEQLGGRGSDFFMSRQSNSHPSHSGNSAKAPEKRLWISYPGFAAVIIGLTIFCVRIEEMTTYDVSPVVGIAIAGFGNQVITTVLVTYAVECCLQGERDAVAGVGVFVNLVRSTWGFIGPFWFPTMFDNLGLVERGEVEVEEEGNEVSWIWRVRP
ncbi:hypothetical protein G7Y89_g10292 [Cudoniella acicularis]|uniref:Major facilitator superfamily (MFS) profile domain-containing protein n=1 Tax=Cudoniella acicularis TaxID=354080 RepID=A0A8H4RD27_9HELO|nr:hypothetical protein G7Y89_g10292 [Cudoniella acicularis]